MGHWMLNKAAFSLAPGSLPGALRDRQNSWASNEMVQPRSSPSRVNPSVALHHARSKPPHFLTTGRFRGDRVSAMTTMSEQERSERFEAQRQRIREQYLRPSREPSPPSAR